MLLGLLPYNFLIVANQREEMEMVLTNYLFLLRLTGFQSLQHTEGCSCSTLHLFFNFSISLSKQIEEKKN